MKQPTVIDLFSGCGGMSYGLYKEGFKILAGIDKWEPALKTFKINHKDAEVICADLTSCRPPKLMNKLGLTRGYLDCLVGGPPCQGFSKNVPAAYRFLKAPRNLLICRTKRYQSFFLGASVGCVLRTLFPRTVNQIP